MSAPDAQAPMPVPKHGGFFHPVVMMLVILGAVTCLTHLLPAGSFDRKDGLVIPGTYHLIEKAAGIEVIFGPRAATGKVTAASLIDAFLAIPKGFTKSTSIITMVLLVGGLFGVLRRSGAIDAGIDWLATRFATRIHLLVVILMCVLGLGSTFLGFISEYLVFIPAVVMLAGRLGYPPLVGLAIVTVAAKIGYAASVTNPLALAVAQPLAGVPLFSGLEYRALVFAVFLSIGIAWVFALIKKSTPSTKVDVAHQAKPLSLRHRSVLSVFLLGMGLLIVGARTWAWSSPEFGAFYVALALLIAVVSGLTVTAASDAFVDGMKSMILAALLIAMASAVDVLLQSAMVLDTIVNAAVELTSEQSAAMVASGLMGTEMVLDVFIPSVSGKAAVSMPILVPIAQAAGVAPNTLILAFVLGSGLTNMVTPTSGMLLAFISAAGVTYRQWIAFVFPLFLALSATGVVMLWILALMTAP